MAVGGDYYAFLDFENISPACQAQQRATHASATEIAAGTATIPTNYAEPTLQLGWWHALVDGHAEPGANVSSFQSGSMFGQSMGVFSP
jgi:hypothetical protein